MRLASALIATLIAINLHAEEISTPTSKAGICSLYKSWDGFQDLAQQEETRMSFVNEGGLLNMGVCWWHSRFFRAATYLTYYKPDLPKPSKSEAKKLIHAIKRRNKVVAIPGYHNFSEFSEEWKSLIQKRLELWQLEGATVGVQWIPGLHGRSKTTAKKMRKLMNKIYADVAIEKNLSYIKLQLKGVSVHSLIVANIKKLDNGYLLKTVDSNSQELHEVKYQFGDQSLAYFSSQYVPYLEQKLEVKKMKKVLRSFCQK